MFKSAHHTIFSKAEWSLRPDAKAIREQPSLIKRLAWEQHQEIHSHVPAVPLLGYHALFRTLRGFQPADSVSGSLDNLMGAIEVAATSPKSHPIETKLALLAVEAIDLQRPYIRAAELMESKSIIDLGQRHE